MLELEFSLKTAWRWSLSPSHTALRPQEDKNQSLGPPDGLCDGPGPGTAATLSDEGFSGPGPLLQSHSCLHKTWLLLPSLFLPLVFPACSLQSQLQQLPQHLHPRPPCQSPHPPPASLPSLDSPEPSVLLPALPSAQGTLGPCVTGGLQHSEVTLDPPAICSPCSQVCPHRG